MFNNDQRLHVYMDAFMYVDPRKMAVEDNLLLIFFVNHKKITISVPVPKNWLVLSYICSEDYGLNNKFDCTEFKKTRENIQQ